MKYFDERWLQLPESCANCFFILSAKEREVFLATVTKRLNTRELAEDLCMNVKTVESHKQNICKKLKFRPRNMMDWMEYAYNKGILAATPKEESQ